MGRCEEVKKGSRQQLREGKRVVTYSAGSRRNSADKRELVGNNTEKKKREKKSADKFSKKRMAIEEFQKKLVDGRKIDRLKKGEGKVLTREEGEGEREREREGRRGYPPLGVTRVRYLDTERAGH